MHQRHVLILSCIITLLLIPFIAMQLSNEVNWSFMDFAIAGILLLTLGVALELIITFSKNKTTRYFLIFLSAIIFLLVWLELAVGVFGSPLAGS